MSGFPRSREHISLLFDVHVHHGACRQLQSLGIDVVHAGDIGLGDAEDSDLLAAATAEGRIVVTRTYQDFAPLVDQLGKQGRSFPGVLFVPPSIEQSDAGAHVRAIQEWVAQAENDGRNPVENTMGWLRAR